MPELSAESLLNLGFKDIGLWVAALRDGCIDYRLDRANAHADGLLLRESNSLYAFVHGDEVKYIGKTARTIRERFTGYRSPTQQQRTNWRCNEKIREMLAFGEHIRILVFNPISSFRYGNFGINLAAGLEDALIEAFDPPWNGRERGRAITEEAEREEIEIAAAKSDTVPTETTDSPPIVQAIRSIYIASFNIVLGKAYYHQGLINPGVTASVYLGDDGDPIEVIFENRNESVISRIDRRANRSGGVRIVGRNSLIATWFQDHFQEGDVVEAQILNRNCILLCLKKNPA